MLSELIFGLVALVILLIAFALASGVLAIVVHRLFGPNLSPSQQRLANTFLLFYRGTGSRLLGALGLVPAALKYLHDRYSGSPEGPKA